MASAVQCRAARTSSSKSRRQPYVARRFLSFLHTNPLSLPYLSTTRVIANADSEVVSCTRSGATSRPGRGSSWATSSRVWSSRRARASRRSSQGTRSCLPSRLPGEYASTGVENMVRTIDSGWRHAVGAASTARMAIPRAVSTVCFLAAPSCKTENPSYRPDSSWTVALTRMTRDGGQAEYVRVPYADGTVMKAPPEIQDQCLVLMVRNSSFMIRDVKRC